jgi:hypothetical protein
LGDSCENKSPIVDGAGFRYFLLSQTEHFGQVEVGKLAKH